MVKKLAAEGEEEGETLVLEAVQLRGQLKNTKKPAENLSRDNKRKDFLVLSIQHRRPPLW